MVYAYKVSMDVLWDRKKSKNKFHTCVHYVYIKCSCCNAMAKQVYIICAHGINSRKLGRQSRSNKNKWEQREDEEKKAKVLLIVSEFFFYLFRLVGNVVENVAI